MVCVQVRFHDQKHLTVAKAIAGGWVKYTRLLCNAKMTFVFQAQMAKKMNDMGRDKVDMMITAGVDIALFW